MKVSSGNSNDSLKDDLSAQTPEVPEMPMGGGQDPMMGGEAPADPNAAPAPEVPEIPEEGGEQPEGDDDSTMALINKLSDEDKESVRAYAQSMLNKSGEGEGEEAPTEAPEVPEVQEGKRFTKKQLREMFGVDKVKDEPKVDNMKRKETRKGNPFNPPKFN